MNSNDTRYKIFQKSKTKNWDSQKSKDPSWKKDQRQQNKRNWQEKG